MSVLLDTGGFFAYLNRQDSLHGKARALVERIALKEFGAPFVTDHVIDELFVLIRVRTGSAALEEAAWKFLPCPPIRCGDSPPMHWVPISSNRRGRPSGSTETERSA
jgi:predicted nucleic acid-binding protein